MLRRRVVWPCVLAFALALLPAIAGAASFSSVSVAAQVQTTTSTTFQSSSPVSASSSASSQDLESVYEVTSVYIEGVVVAPTSETPLEMSYVMTEETAGSVAFHFETADDAVLTLGLGATALKRPTFTGIDQGSQVPEPAAALVFAAGLLIFVFARRRATA